MFPWQRREGEMPRPYSDRAIRGAGFLFLSAMLVGACVPKVPQQSPLARAADSRVASGQLRATENALAVTVPGEIETTADEIIARTEDPEVRREALRWKLEAIPTYYQTLFQRNSLAAAMDTVVLSAQVENYLATGPGRGRFGDMQAMVLEGARKTRADIAEQMRAVAVRPEAFERVMQRLDTWARAHPIPGASLFSRPSVVPLLTRLAGPDEQNVFGVVGDIEGSVADLGTRLDIYTAYVPRASRWQAELLAGDLAAQEEARVTVSALTSLEKVTQRIDTLVSPESIDEATQFAASTLRAEHAQTMQEIEQIKAEVLASLKGERVIVMAAVDSEVKAARADIDSQRAEILMRLEELRGQTLVEVEQLRRQSFVDLEALTNRVIIRIALMMALILALAALLATVVVRYRTRVMT